MVLPMRQQRVSWSPSHRAAGSASQTKTDCSRVTWTSQLLQKRASCREKEEGLPPDGGFLVANTDPQWRHEQMPQLVDALDLVPLYVREQEEKEISDCAVKALLAVKSCVEQLARKYAIDSQALPN